MLKAENLSKSYGNKQVVKNVSLNVQEGEVVGLLGPNGAGKTTSFYMIVGLIKANNGNVLLNDSNITNIPMYQRAKLGIGYLSQEASIFRKMSVKNNILSVLEMTNLSKKEQIYKCNQLIDEFGLEKVKDSNGDVLSGGERRRAEIARALSLDPKYILLDEPFAGVDPIAVEDIQQIVTSLKEKNIGVLITDHNVRETLSITDRSYLLYDGKILKYGNTIDLINVPEVRRLYLGDNFRF